jgi:hypothetical protein
MRFIDAKPLWNRLDRGPDFICEECSKNAIRIDNEIEIAAVIARMYLKSLNCKDSGQK